MLGTIFSLAAPIMFPGMSPMMASAIGGGIGSLLQGGSTEDALKGAALGGLGGYLGGQMGSSAVGGVNPANPTAGLANDVTSQLSPFGPGMDSALHTQLPANIAGTAPPASIMSQLTRPEAIGAGLGGFAADSMMKPPAIEEKPEEEVIRGMPIKNTSLFGDYGYDAGANKELDYNIAKNYAEGGDLQDPMAMEMGLGSMQNEGMGESGMNDKQLISGAIDVIQGEVQDPDQQKVILGQFVAQFGQQALQDLVGKVQSGEIGGEPKEGDGMVTGAGDGMADMIPASLGQDQDVLLSDGEFVVPADVVSGIGNGSSDSGSDKLYEMMDRVREMRTGGTTQPPAVPSQMMLPA